MARPTHPGVFVEETAGPSSITGVPTSIAAFVGPTTDGTPNEPAEATSVAEFERAFGTFSPDAPLGYAVRDFFANGGRRAFVVRTESAEPDDYRAGLDALDRVDLFNLLCVPPPVLAGATNPIVNAAAAAYARRRRAFFIVDAPQAWDDLARAGELDAIVPERLGITGSDARNAAVYFPRAAMADPVSSSTQVFPVSGLVAGVIARTDAARGVWKAPAGTEATLHGVSALNHRLTDAQQEVLNTRGVNCLRTFPDRGHVVWGARTLANDGDHKYISARRLALFIAESVERGTEFAVFEANGDALWGRLRLMVATFLDDLFRRGAFAGAQPRQSYFVRCDRSTHTAEDIANGVVNIHLGFAALRPAEFVSLNVRQTTAGA